jgi:BRCA1 C Terminus (BRCT) domain/SAP domain
MSGDEPSTWSLDALRKELKKYGLSCGGKKEEMVVRVEGLRSTDARWYWHGDSEHGEQDVRIEYKDHMQKVLESVWNERLYRDVRALKLLKRLIQIPVDDERYIDLAESKFYQRRYDDPIGRCRLVERKLVNMSDDDDDDDEKEKEKGEEQEQEQEQEQDDDDDENFDDEKSVTEWFWAADSPPTDDNPEGGDQDLWVRYPIAMCVALESAWIKHDAEVRVDDQRFADLRHFCQRRYDDPYGRWRNIKRGKSVMVKDVVDKKAKAKTKTKKKKKASLSTIANASTCLQGFVFCMTGKMSITRKEMAAIIAKHAGNVAGSVTSALTHLIAAQEEAGTVKWKQALARDIPIVTEMFVHARVAGLPADTSHYLKMSSASAAAVAMSTMASSSSSESSSSSSSSSKKHVLDSGNDDEDDDVAHANKKQKSSSSSSSQALASALPFDYPSYWALPCHGYAEVDADTSSEEFTEMAALLQNTIADYHRNASWIHPVKYTNLRLVRLVRIQNPVTWLVYKNRRDYLRYEFEQRASPLVPVHDVLTSSAPVDPSVNEYKLFHGLNASHIPGICRFGFDPRFSSLAGMFGSAVYVCCRRARARIATNTNLSLLVGEEVCRQ